MIIYKELSSLARDLGFSAKALYTASNCTARLYRQIKIPKGNGECRQLSVPNEFLKAMQRKIVEKLLCYEEISPYATAYCWGSSTIRNARPHVKQETVLKLDIKNFFDNIIYPLVKEKVFPKERYSEKNRILLTLICVHNGVLPQGAPTSPMISNIIMKDFDNTVGAWCAEKGIKYTRYCDDMTFSGKFNPQEVKSLVKAELQALGFYLNDKKTVILGKGQKRIVTGIVVNEKPNTALSYRKALRQELYYCMKFGISSHLKHKGIATSEQEYIRSLLGRVNYVLSVTPEHKEMAAYKTWLAEQLKSIG